MRTGLLLLLLFIPFAWVWSTFPPEHRATERLKDVSVPAAVQQIIWITAIGGLILGLIISFKMKTAPFLAPVYALFEGAFLGGVSVGFESVFPGIAVQAAGCTVGTLAALLLAYKSGVIKATENFKLGVTAATGGVMLLYLASFILRLFGVQVPFVHETGIVGIGISAVIVCIAALNLVLDFDFIEQGAQRNAPKYMEWYAAFGLLVTLIWLYLEMLRLIAKLRSKD